MLDKIFRSVRFWNVGKHRGIRYKRVGENETCLTPRYATEGSVGMDLRASIQESMHIASGDLCLVPTGIALDMSNSPDMAAFLFIRSGLSRRNRLMLSNGVGVIDNDYQGEICASLFNAGNVGYTIRPQDRIAQIVFLPVLYAKLVEVDNFQNVTQRGGGGFGSTGAS